MKNFLLPLIFLSGCTLHKSKIIYEKPQYLDEVSLEITYTDKYQDTLNVIFWLADTSSFKQMVTYGEGYKITHGVYLNSCRIECKSEILDTEFNDIKGIVLGYKIINNK